MLDVCLLGCGGMMPLPYRWLTALMTRFNGSSLLIDCGEGTQIAIKEKGWSFKPIDVICFTHYHGDHISGLPGLLLTMGNADRTEPLTLIGPKGLERVVNALRVIAPELPFELKFIEITQPEETMELNGYRLKAFRVNHNVLCYGYTLEIDRAGKFDLEDMLTQMEQMNKMGPLKMILKLIPGMPKLTDEQKQEAEDKLKVTRAIIYSMTVKERRNTEIIKASRKARIAKGCGKDVSDVNRLLRQFEQMSAQMMQLGKMMKSGRMPNIRR